MEPKILLIDDDLDYVSVLLKRLQASGAKVITAHSAQEGLKLARQNDPDIVLLDVILPDQQGFEIVPEIKDIEEQMPIIMISSHGDTELVVSAMKAGASDYVNKSLSYEELWEKIATLLEMRHTLYTEKELKSTFGENKILGKSPQIKNLIREISKIANSDAPVLLRGESGTGKGLLAEVIHSYSSRREGPFVTINCTAIPENLLESELFGHEKGAFTGAIREKKGKFEVADRGTIFLDEIGDLSLEMQVKILRVLQNYEFERVGGIKTLRVNTRIIAATNRDLEEAIQKRNFREDLFYRLNVLPIYIPPLRERKEDIPLLVSHFTKQFCARANKPVMQIAKKAMDHLVNYSWPGNIRELQNILERAITLAIGPELRVRDFAIDQAYRTTPVKTTAEITSLKDLEYQALIRALEQASGIISRAAKSLGVSRNTIYRQLKKYNISLKR